MRGERKRTMTAKPDFKYLNAELYRHPGERAARERLKKIPGFQKALDMLTDSSGADAERQAETASMIRVGPGVYPRLHELWVDIQSRFGLSGIPLHATASARVPCSLRGGNDRPVVILDCALLDDLPEREMSALLAMQAGTVRLGNASLVAAADFSRWFIDVYGILGAPALLPAWGLENWRRYAAFSADRAAALAEGDPESVASLLNRFAGAGSSAWGGITRPDDIRVQGLEALSRQADWSNNKIRRFALAMNRQNDVALIRRLDLMDWFAEGVPARILSGEVTEPEGATFDAGAAWSGTDKDPSLAYWGEFAGGGSDSSDKSSSGCPFCGMKDAAGKGINSFMKAGEAFWNTLMDNMKK